MRIKNFGLRESLDKGHLVLLSDAQLRGACDRLNPLGFNGICEWHSVGCIIRNFTEKFLPEFDAEADEKWQVRKRVSFDYISGSVRAKPLSVKKTT